MTQEELTPEQQKCLDNIESISDYYNFKDQQALVKVVLNENLAKRMFIDRKVEPPIFKRFSQKNSSLQQEDKIAYFANKYTYQRLCEKYSKPKGTLYTLRHIFSKKMRTEPMPANLRNDIWLLCSGAKYCVQSNPGVYALLHSTKEYPDIFDRTIMLDLRRTRLTYPAPNDEEHYKPLYRILTAFSRRNPYVGYCQGINYIANYILTFGFSEEESFWLLSQIVETVIPVDYYTNMIGIITDQNIFSEMIQQRSPKVSAHLQHLGLDLSIFAIQWLVCLFSASLPEHLVRIVWDRLIVEGVAALLKTSIVIIEIFSQQILGSTDFVEEGIKGLQISQQEFSAKIDAVYMHTRGLELTRDLYRELHLKQKLAERIQDSSPAILPECNSSWPVCTHAIELAKFTREDPLVWTFRQKNPPNLVSNYIEMRHKPAPTPQTTFDNIMIGRIPHVCIGKVEFAKQYAKNTTNNDRKSDRKSVKYNPALTMILELSDDLFEEQSSSPLSPQRRPNRKSSLQLMHEGAEKTEVLRHSQSVIFYRQFMKNHIVLMEMISEDVDETTTVSRITKSIRPTQDKR